MPKNFKDRAGSVPPDAAKDIAQAGEHEQGKNSTTLTRVQILASKPHPTRHGYSVIEIRGQAPFTIADKRLRTFKSFRNVCRHRFAIELETVLDHQWEAMVAAARQGGGS
jgi:hypothetical protein